MFDQLAKMHPLASDARRDIAESADSEALHTIVRDLRDAGLTCSTEQVAEILSESLVPA